MLSVVTVTATMTAAAVPMAAVLMFLVPLVTSPMRFVTARSLNDDCSWPLTVTPAVPIRVVYN